MHLTRQFFGVKPENSVMESTSVSSNSNIFKVEDAFDQSNQPKMFMSENRISAIVELSSLVVYIVFLAILCIVIGILPGIRKTRVVSLFSLLVLILTGSTIFLSLHGTNWLEGSVEVNDARYSVTSRDFFNGTIGLNVGLQSANVTLQGIAFEKLTQGESKQGASNERQIDLQQIPHAELAKGNYVNLNERYYWIEAEQATNEHIAALKKGLPNPVLTITEFLSQDSDGFNWSRRLRSAGFYTTILLYITLTNYILTVVLMCSIPDYLPAMIQTTGFLMIMTASIYSAIISINGNFDLHVSNSKIQLSFGTTLIRIFGVGFIVVLSGKILDAINSYNPGEQLTIMDYEPHRKDKLACIQYKV